MGLSNSQSGKVKRALDMHSKYKFCYFWTNIGSSSSRRYQEKRDSIEIQFKHDGHVYRYRSDVTLSCKNAYYRAGFYLDGIKKNSRLFSKLLP